MYGHLKLTAAPETEPITLAEFKSHIDYTASDRDDYLNTLIKTARQYCENVTKRSLFTQTWTRSMDCFPGNTGIIELHRGPVQTITSIKYYDSNGDEQTLDSAAYQLDNNREPARLAPTSEYTWPSTDSDTLSAVKIAYVTGWDDEDDIPADFKHAIKLLASHWFENPSTVTIDGTPKNVPMTVSALLSLNDYTII